jgi:hypothetical protein
MMVDVADVPKRFELAVGERAAIELPSYSGSGNAWSVSCLSGETVAAVTIEVGPGPRSAPGGNESETEPPTPAVVRERAVVVGLSPGSARWLITLSRSFSPEPPSANIELTIRVSR